MTPTPFSPDPRGEETTISGEPSLVDAHTLLAYRETEYRVGGDRPFVLRVDARSPELLELHVRHDVSCSAFVTACNPFGRLLDARADARRRSRLSDELARAGVPCIDGIGQHPSGDWPGEPSVLALGLDLGAALGLGRRHEQNALLWSGADATPRLVLLR